MFKNPLGDHAGRLIEQVGLIELAQQRVREATGVERLPEVRRVGWFEQMPRRYA